MGFFDNLFGGSKEGELSATDRLPFRLAIEKITSLPKRGTIVIGPVQRGVLKTGDTVEIAGRSGKPIKAQVIGMEMNSAIIEKAKSGDTIGCLLMDVKASDIQPGQMMCKPGTSGD